jgi:phosphatidate cytidylyltransferase
MLRWRLLLGTALIAALLGLCVLDHLGPYPGLWLFPVAVVVTLMAGNEMLALLAAANLRPIPWVVHCGNLLLVLSPWLPGIYGKLSAGTVLGPPVSAGGEGPAITWSLLVLAIALLLAFAGEIRRYEQPGGAMANLAGGALAMTYVGLMLCLVFDLRLRWGIGALASLLIVAKMGDAGAYFLGRWLGRHKMSPVLSPGKTVEGALGALAFGCAGSWFVFARLVPWLTLGTVRASPWWSWLGFGLLIALTGMLGDLAESLLKRDALRKDSSDWLPGFGGVLDLLDSILLAAPVAYACWALGLVGT